MRLTVTEGLGNSSHGSPAWAAGRTASRARPSQPVRRRDLQRFKRIAVAGGVVDIVLGRFLQLCHVLVAEFAYYLAGRADDQRTVGEHLALRDQRIGANDAALADHGPVEDHRADADQAAVAYRAAVQHDQVADRDVVADMHRHALVGVQYRAVLDVGVVADVDRVVVAAQRGVPPDRGVLAEAHVADHRGVGGDPGVVADVRRLGAEFEEGHGFLLWAP